MIPFLTKLLRIGAPATAKSHLTGGAGASNAPTRRLQPAQRVLNRSIRTRMNEMREAFGLSPFKAVGE